MLIKVWLYQRDEGVMWLMNLSNIILDLTKMLDKWRFTIVILNNKKKRSQWCNNYKGIKLLSHTMKTCERVLEARLKHEKLIYDSQYGYMPKRLTTKAIYHWSLMEKYITRNRYLQVVPIYLENAYDIIPMETV